MSPFIPLVTRGLLRAHLILFRRHADEDHVGVFGIIEAHLALASVALLTVMLRGLLDPWQPIGPVLIPAIILMAALSAWWLARYKGLMDAMGPLADPDAPTGFTGHAAYVWNTSGKAMPKKRFNEWSILGVAEPLKLVVPGLAMLGFQSTAAAGILLLAVAAAAAIQTRRDRSLDRFAAEREASFARDDVSVMDNGDETVDAVSDDEEFEESLVHQVGVAHKYDEYGMLEGHPIPPESFYQKRHPIKPPVQRGPQSAPNLRWPSLVLTCTALTCSLGVWAGDRFGIYESAPGRVLAVAKSIDRELAVVGLSPGGSSGYGLDDLMLQRVDQVAWRDRRSRAVRTAWRETLLSEHAAAVQTAREVRLACESMPGEFELAPGPAAFHEVLLKDEPIAADWTRIVLGLAAVEVSLEELRAEIAHLLEETTSADSLKARAEPVRDRIFTMKETLTEMSRAQQRVAAAL